MMSDCPLAVGSRVWAYVRVSGEDQVERGTPISGQRAEVLRHCEENSLMLTRWFVDEARPGATVAGRDQLEELIRLAHQDGRSADGSSSGPGRGLDGTRWTPISSRASGSVRKSRMGTTWSPNAEAETEKKAKVGIRRDLGGGRRWRK